jgi:putative ABC transport system permease protein
VSALRAALRLAWRGMRRDRGRCALIVALIGLPVMAVTAVLTLVATHSLDGREALPGRLGSADALIRAVGDVPPRTRTATTGGRPGGAGRRRTRPRRARCCAPAPG